MLADIDLCFRKNTLPDWKSFAITAGYVQSLKTYAVGGQVKALTKHSLNWESLESSYNAGGLFHGLSIIAFVPKSKPISDVSCYSTIVILYLTVKVPIP